MALGVGALGVNLKRAFRTRSPPERRARHWDPNFPHFPVWREGARDTKQRRSARSPRWKGV